MLQQRVLIAEDVEEATTEGGLFVPEGIARNLGKGTIVAVEESKLRVKDKVLFDKRQALTLKLEGTEYVILHEAQVLAVLGKKKAKVSST